MTGRIQGRQILALSPRGRRILYVQGSSRSLAAKDRTAGMREATRGAAFEANTLDGAWSADGAYEATRQWLSIAARGALHLDLVACQNDQMGLGARRALEEMAGEVRKPELARVPLTGCDGTPETGQRLVREGRLAATIVLPRSSGAAIGLLVRAGRGEPVPPLVLLPPTSYPPETELKALG